MKLNEHIDSYDVKSLSDVEQAVIKLKGHCENMELLGSALKNNIAVARENGFESVNCDKAEEIVNEYCKRLNGAKEEFSELAESVKAFTEKINNIWNSWR